MRGLSHSKRCSCCGAELSFISQDFRFWKYKTRDEGNRVLYQCGYACWRKETIRLEEKNVKRRYNNVGRS